MNVVAQWSRTQSVSETNLTYAGWKVVLAGFFGVMVSFAAVVPYTFGLFLKPLSLSFGWHREAISAGFSIAALTLAAASPGLGFLLDRFGPRRVILPCILIFSFAYASLALLTPHLIHFYLMFFLVGLVGNGYRVPRVFAGHRHPVSPPPRPGAFDHARRRRLWRHDPAGRCASGDYPLWLA